MLIPLWHCFICKHSLGNYLIAACMLTTLQPERHSMPAWQDGDTIEYIIFRVYFISFPPNYRVQILWYIVK